MQFVLPLPKQRLRHDQQDASLPLGHELTDDQPGLDGLAEADLVRQDAAAFRDPAQRKDHGVDLVRVRIDPPTALAGGVAALVVRPTQADQIFGEESATNGT